jgi:hypothetical protein
MNWDAIGAVGEWLGAIAVFVTLVYLALQVRHARAEVQRSLGQSRAETVRDLLLTRATDVRLGGLYVKATLGLNGGLPNFVAVLMERTGMTVEDAVSLYWDQLAWWQYRLQVIPYVDELAADPRAEFDLGVRQNYGSQPLETLFYETTRKSLSPEAVRYVDALLARTG